MERSNFYTFWNNTPLSLTEYVSEYPTDKLIKSIEEELDYKLPSFYLEMMKIQNGGTPLEYCFATVKPTSWAEDHIAIEGIYGIGRKKKYSLCGSRGSKFIVDEWGYPDIGIYICDCPSAGHDMIALDYRGKGRKGEPGVVHVDQKLGNKITFLAKDFEGFINGLSGLEVFD
jgi:hypothetical protein